MMRQALAALLLALGSAAGLAMDYERSNGEYIDMGVVAAHALTTEHSITAAFQAESDPGAFSGLVTRYQGTTNRTLMLGVAAGAPGNPIRAQASAGSSGTGSYGVDSSSDGADGTQYVATAAFSSSSSAILHVNGSAEDTDGTVSAAETGSWNTNVAAVNGSSAFDGLMWVSLIHDTKLSTEAHGTLATLGLPLFDPVSAYRPDLQYGLGNACTGTVQDEMATGADGTCVNTPTAGTIPYRLHR